MQLMPNIFILSNHISPNSARRVAYDVNIKNVELCIEEEAGKALKRTLDASTGQFEEKYGPFEFEVSFGSFSVFLSSRVQDISTKFIHGNHVFNFSAEKENEGGISVSMQWNYKGKDEDLKGNTFFFNAELKSRNCVTQASCKASIAAGPKDTVKRYFCSNYASVQRFYNGLEPECFQCCENFKIFLFVCKLEFGFRW